MSLPSGGAWIEITASAASNEGRGVAPLAGSVDRNGSERLRKLREQVAPLAGSVDRNKMQCNAAEGWETSLPSRGAWIEMQYMGARYEQWAESLPSRGAWIEIM